MSQRIASQWFLAAQMALCLISCRGSGNDFPAPEITNVEAVVTGTTAMLRCTLSNGRIERCGFRLSDGETEAELDAVLSGTAFETEVQGLRVDKTYSWVAFISASESEICSRLQTFTAPEGIIPIPDPAFKKYLVNNYDTDIDGELSQAEAKTIWRISFCTNELNVKSLSGIQYMPALEEINCPGEFLDNFDLGDREHYYLSRRYQFDKYGPIGTLEYVDVSRNLALRVLRLGNNAALGDLLQTLDLSKNISLERLDLGMTALQMPDVSHLPGLVEMRFSHLWGPFPNLELFAKLEVLDFCFEQTGRKMDVDVSHCPNLEELYIGGIAKTLSDLSFNPKIRVLMDICNGFTERDLSVLPKLTAFHGHGNHYRSLDVSVNPDLISLMVSPMENNLLETLYIAPGQKIPGVTENRSEEYIPIYTQIVVKSVE